MGSGEKKKKSNQKKDGSGHGRKHEERHPMITDERFSAAQSDPRFMEVPKKRSKVEVDSRFDRLFTDRSFASSKAPIDKRGKPNTNKDKAGSSLSHYYRPQQQQEKKKITEESEDDDSEGDNDAESLSESDSEKLKTTFEDEEEDESMSVDESSSTDTTDSESGFENEEDDEEDAFAPLVENVPEIDKETRRLAVVNLDWTHVRAVDLFVLLSSFLPKGCQIMSVTVYPTEFGLKRMEEESVHGPIGLFSDDEKEKENGDEEDDDDDDDDDEIDNKKIRAYELSKLRYYYAVVECDSIATADYLYKTCDGVEFERSANTLDLRFIPDSMEFKHQPRDVATEAPADYEGLDFETRALHHSGDIHIAWDEDEPHRSKTFKRLLKSDQPAESELNEVLATDESETDDDDDEIADVMNNNKSQKKQKRQDKYRSLIQAGNGSDKDDEEDNDQNMEVTFNSGLEDISKHILENKDKKSETVWEATLRKKKEKKKALRKRSKYSSDDESDDYDDDDREIGEDADDFFVEDKQVHGTKAEENDKEAEASRAELELLLTDVRGENSKIKGSKLKPKKKGKKGKEDPVEEKLPTVDYNDPRFSARLNNPHFALDPTDPQYKRTAVYARQIAQKETKGDMVNVRKMDHLVNSGEASEVGEVETVKNDTLAKTKENHELSSLVRSIKMKSKQTPLQFERKVQRNHKLKANLQK